MGHEQSLAGAGEAMSFRRRLLLMFVVTVVLSVSIVSAIVLLTARKAFDRTNDEQTSALVAQFTQEFTRRGEEVGKRLQAAASTPEAAHIAIAAARPSPQYNLFVDDAQAIAQIEQLDFLEFVDDRGTIISSAQWPAKFGYQEPGALRSPPGTPFLKEEETASGAILGLFSVRAMPAGDRKLYVIGGIRLDRDFLSSLKLPAGMRVMIYENLTASQAFSPDRIITAGGSLADPQELRQLIETVQKSRHPETAQIDWESGGSELFHAFPLPGENGQLLAVLLAGNSRQSYLAFRTQIRSAALFAAGGGLLLALVLSSWAAVRVTRPIEELARAAQQVAQGDWSTHVDVKLNDEIGRLAGSFNRMTTDLADQRERLIQAERVAAWRELARRLAHELKNPLFPLQLTVENLVRSREQNPKQFDEDFPESATTLLAEVANLKNIIGRFSEFSRMPQPHLQPVQMEDVIEQTLQVFKAQMERTNIHLVRASAVNTTILADPDLLHRAISNLISNAIEAMPAGGTMTVATRLENRSVYIEITDTGPGLSQEMVEDLFTPYHTSKPHGTGLGLAIAQSIVTDHGGRISARSEPGRGTSFMIELPQGRVPAATTGDA
jgi:signal transduction histidine kinase